MLQHVTVHTSKLEECILFYEKHIGLHITRDLRPFGSPIVFLGMVAKETQVELIERPKQAYQGSGISIGFATDNIEASHTYFMEHELQPTPIIRPNPHTAFFFVKDPSGLSIQIIHEATEKE